MNNNPNIKVLYHANCPDGAASAWAVWKSMGDAAEYIPCSYGQDPPDVAGAHVVIVDFSYKRGVMLQMAAEAQSILVLDHHVSAERELSGINPGRSVAHLTVVFDMDRSGATLAWQYFHGDEPCWLVKYAEDRDLWRHALPKTKEINAYLAAMPKTFAAYDEAFAAGPDAIAIRGEGCLTWVRYYVDSVKKLARRLRFLGHDNIPVVNAPYTATSEVVGELAEDDVQFAVGWHVNADGAVVYSLRSRGEFDVSQLAESMGGGGHVKAAGFVCTRLPDDLEEPG